MRHRTRIMVLVCTLLISGCEAHIKAALQEFSQASAELMMAEIDEEHTVPDTAMPPLETLETLLNSMCRPVATLAGEYLQGIRSGWQEVTRAIFASDSCMRASGTVKERLGAGGNRSPSRPQLRE